MIYNLMITEHLRRSVRVDADSFEDAELKVAGLIHSGDIELTADDFSGRDIDTLDGYENSTGNLRSCLTHDSGCRVDMDFTGTERGGR